MPKNEPNSKHVLRNDLQARLKKINERLKAGGVKVTVVIVRRCLYLQATLPPRPDSTRLDLHQQKISLGYRLNPANLERAEKEARKVGALKDCHQFDWAPYLTVKPAKPETCGDWIKRFEQEFKATVEPITWKTDYANSFKKLPTDQPLTEEILRMAISTATPNSRTCKRLSSVFAKLAEFAGLKSDFKALRGNYSASAVEPRDIPSDEAIVATWEAMTNPGWKWVLGMIATFGLRSHEVFYLDTSDLVAGGQTVYVTEGKTVSHRVWAFYPEWIEQFNLRSPVLPPVTGKQHADFTQRTSKYFGQVAKLPFTALDLRHAWAIRTLAFGLPTDLAAKQMAHSLDVHERTYQRWIKADLHQRVYELICNKSDRPLPPIN